jgi:hypothetical protein
MARRPPRFSARGPEYRPVPRNDRSIDKVAKCNFATLFFLAFTETAHLPRCQAAFRFDSARQRGILHHPIRAMRRDLREYPTGDGAMHRLSPSSVAGFCRGSAARFFRALASSGLLRPRGISLWHACCSSGSS